MTAKECRAGGKHVARERGAFEKEEETPELTAEHPPELQFPGYAVPLVKLFEVVRWKDKA